jgi:hypothetical protein
MKRLSVVLFLGFFVSSFCPAQIQTGSAAVDPSKPGLFISHSSLSFNTRVRVTNLRNKRSVEAVVNGRIPISSEKIADVSREAGAVLEMDQAGLTPVEIAILPHVNAGEAAVTPAVVQIPQPEGTAASREQTTPPPAQGQASSSSDSREQSSNSSVQVPQILPVQTVTDIQYVPVPSPVQSNCCNWPFMIVILALLIVAIILLLVILILILRRLLLWPWHYQVWYRRHLLCAKRRRRETGR